MVWCHLQTLGIAYILISIHEMLDFHSRKRLDTLISVWEKVLEALKTAELLPHHNNRTILYLNQSCPI